MTDYLNPHVRHDGTKQIIVPGRTIGGRQEDAPFDGDLYVRQNGEWVPATFSELNGIDTSSTTVEDGQTLIYDAGTDTWKNSWITLDDLTGVVISNDGDPPADSHLVYNGTWWEDVEPTLRMQAGRTSVSFSSSTLATRSVSFPVAFAATPRVVIQIANGAGALNGCTTRVWGQSSTGFSFYLNLPSSQTVTAEVDWIATLDGVLYA